MMFSIAVCHSNWAKSGKIKVKDTQRKNKQLKFKKSIKHYLLEMKLTKPKLKPDPSNGAALTCPV